MNPKKTKSEQPSAESSATTNQNADQIAGTSGNTPPNESQQPDYTGEALKQAAAQEPLIFKAKINTAARMSYQAFKLNYAKKLAGAGGDEKQPLEAFYTKAEEFGFKKRTVQRRVQTAQAMINQNFVDTDLLVKIQKSETLDAGLLAEIESIIEDKVGSTSYTALMQHLGVLEKAGDNEDSEEDEEKEVSTDARIKTSFDSAYKFIDRVYELRRKLRKDGASIDSGAQEVFDALDRALVALGYYLSPNRVASETAQIELAKEIISKEIAEEALESKMAEV